MHNLCTRFVTGELIIHRWSLILLALSLTLVSLPASPTEHTWEMPLRFTLSM